MVEELSGERHGRPENPEAGKAGGDPASAGAFTRNHDSAIDLRSHSGSTETPLCLVDPSGGAGNHSRGVWATATGSHGRHLPPAVGLHAPEAREAGV